MIITSKTWVEISRSALEHNLQEFRKILGAKVQLMSVVKANAYGHGLLNVAEVAQERADWFGVDSIDEAITLRQAKINKPILILGYTLNERLADLLDHSLSQTVYNQETVKLLGQITNKNKRTARLHLKIETGTSRQGIFTEDLVDFVKLIERYPNLKIEGISTHFANVEDTTEHSFAQKQLANFKRAVDLLEDREVKIPLKHTACSAAAILFPETHFNMARVGIGQYGLWPSKETKISAQQMNRSLILKPAMTWKTRIAQIKKVASGTPVSYGCTEKVSRDSNIAILPVGYFDGFDRKLSSVGNVLIHGQRAKVLGRVCMNMIIVDVSHIKDVVVEDEAVILGKQAQEEISAEEIANKMGSVNYEVITRINPLIPRITVV